LAAVHRVLVVSVSDRMLVSVSADYPVVSAELMRAVLQV